MTEEPIIFQCTRKPNGKPQIGEGISAGVALDALCVLWSLGLIELRPEAAEWARQRGMRFGHAVRFPAFRPAAAGGIDIDQLADLVAAKLAERMGAAHGRRPAHSGPPGRAGDGANQRGGGGTPDPRQHRHTPGDQAMNYRIDHYMTTDRLRHVCEVVELETGRTLHVTRPRVRQDKAIADAQAWARNHRIPAEA